MADKPRHESMEVHAGSLPEGPEKEGVSMYLIHVPERGSRLSQCELFVATYDLRCLPFQDALIEFIDLRWYLDCLLI